MTLLIGVLLLTPSLASAGDAWDQLRLRYDRPAAKWDEALPVGNGRLGAMQFGGTAVERLQFNEDTLWTGRPHDYTNPEAREYLPQVRKLLFEGRQREAERLAMEHLMSRPLRQMMYQPFGDVYVDLAGHEQAADYQRTLDLDSGVATVRYRVGDVVYTREVFASAPAQAIVVRIAADRPGRLTCTLRLESPQPGAAVDLAGADQLRLHGRLQDRAEPRSKEVMPCVLRYEARLVVRPQGGRLQPTGSSIRVAGADRLTLVLVAATSFRNYRDVSADPAQRCSQQLAQIGTASFDALRAAHVADHRRLMRRVSLDLGTSPATAQPTDRRIKDALRQSDPQLAVLYFQFGRYLLAASSRPGSQPANLQGIWNDQLVPPWGSKWTVNINTEMNYWPAEVANLAECHEPLFAMIDDLAVTGRRTAQVHYGCRGWVLHHNTDLWRGAAPINNSNHGIWMTGGAWLAQHLWEHYLFGGDREFLARRAYPVLKDASLFFVDFLVKDPKTGWLISTPSNSPEQGGLVAGPTMDHQIIRELLAATMRAAGILGVDEPLVQELKHVHDRIAPNQVGRFGQLQEWLDDRDDPRNDHRHLSHMFAFYPGCEITLRGTPKLAQACRVSLEHRGDGGMGWSKAWKVSLWARLEDGNHAYKMLHELIAMNTLPNMLDSCPPFQIDGNFGGTAGLAEMLLQSHAGEVSLLPALPDAWPQGRVTGLRARGGLEVEIAWRAGRALSATLKASLAGRPKIRLPHGQRIADVRSAGQAVPITTEPDGTTALTVEPGRTYELRMR
jgi:alpha-L-fucosidase 2